MLQIRNVHDSSKGGPFSAGTAYRVWHLGGWGGCSTDGDLIIICNGMAASGLYQEAWWESMRLSARRKRSSIVIPLESARVWAGRHDNHISHRRSMVRELPWLLGGKLDVT